MNSLAARGSCRECGDLKFWIGAETAAGRVAQQQPVHGQRGLVGAAKPFDAPTGRTDGGAHFVADCPRAARRSSMVGSPGMPIHAHSVVVPAGRVSGRWDPAA